MNPPIQDRRPTRPFPEAARRRQRLLFCLPPRFEYASPCGEVSNGHLLYLSLQISIRRRLTPRFRFTPYGFSNEAAKQYQRERES